MSSFELVVRLNSYQYLIKIITQETVPQIKTRIKSMCNVDLTNGEYILEVYDTTLDDYIVLTERYLMELKKHLLTTTTIQRLQARLEPLQRIRKYISLDTRRHIVARSHCDHGRRLIIEVTMRHSI